MIVPSISILATLASAAAVVNRDQHCDCGPTSNVPEYFQTSYGPYAGPTAVGAPPFLAQTNPVSFGEPTYVPNTPMVTHVPLPGKPSHGDIFKHMGNLSPYMPNPSGFGAEEYPLPPGANITQMHMVHRHGARYPTSSADVAQLPDRIAELRRNGTVFHGELSFLNDWSYQLGKEELTAVGRQELFDSGVLHYLNYGGLYEPSTKIVARTTTQVRMLQSAENFLNGFFGPNWTRNVSLEVIIERTGFNNSLAEDKACPNWNNERSKGGKKASAEWADIYLQRATERFRRQMSGNPDWTAADTYIIQSMCPYETVGLGYSPFCLLFTWDEWQGFEYSLDLSYYGGASFGSPTARAVGIGFVEELISRLEHHYPDPKPGSIAINETLDQLPSTFPLNQTMYLDFSHDTDMAAMMTALGLRQFAQFLPITGPPHNQQLVVSHIVPFAGRFVIEVITAPRPVKEKRSQNPHESQYERHGGETVYVHMVNNQRTIPFGRSIPECGQRDDGWCELRTFIQAQKGNIEKAKYEESCFGDYPTPKYGDITDGVI